MDDNEILQKFGIGKKLAYGLFFQSILIIIITIFSMFGIFYFKRDFTLAYITNIISLLVCISLLVYSFYGFHAKKNQEAFFASSLILYLILIAIGIFTSIIDFKNPVSLLVELIPLICFVVFLCYYTKSYKIANIAMLIFLIFEVIILIHNVMIGGMSLILVLKYVIIPVTIWLTYYERVFRRKYPFIKK